MPSISAILAELRDLICQAVQLDLIPFGLGSGEQIIAVSVELV
jgi:hypothetical protein